MTSDHHRWVLLATAAIFAFFGLWALADPVGLLGMIDVRVDGPDGQADIRAMYGGLELAMAAALVWHARSPADVPRGLALGALAVGGLGSGRLLGLLIGGGTSLTVALCVFELGGAAFVAAVARRASSVPGAIADNPGST